MRHGALRADPCNKRTSHVRDKPRVAVLSALPVAWPLAHPAAARTNGRHVATWHAASRVRRGALQRSAHCVPHWRAQLGRTRSGNDVLSLSGNLPKWELA
jgi:hypothetical protein